MELIKNRYQQLTPTAVSANGCAISCPVYLNCTDDQNKALLNGFRNLVAKQRREMGWDDTPKSLGQLSVETKTKPPITPCEEELGLTEESLRYALFNRGGSPERLILKLSALTGVYVTSRSEIEEVQKKWLDNFYDTPEKSAATTTRKTSKTGTKRAKAKELSSAASTTPAVVVPEAES